MPVGTQANVKTLTPRDLREIGAEIILSNTYHLWLRPGREIITHAGGLHRFMAWDRPILTDSGGFQVFSLQSRRTLDDDGVRFRSHLDGSAHHFTPEAVVDFQEALGVDVAMVLDVCVKLPAKHDELAQSVRRTSLWAARSAVARTREKTLLFGIVQGGIDRELRARSAEEISVLGFSGHAIGGLSVGESREEMETIARYTANLLPPDRPRYLMGVGTVRDLIVGIDCGIDLFDCVYPTRCGRHGRVITRTGEYNLRAARHLREDGPLEDDCDCEVCTTFSRAYLCHLLRAEEMLAARLLSYHNLARMLSLMRQARSAIEQGRWAEFRDLLKDA
jgi:queuine tRNA-ribosyltransferase